MPFIDYVFYCHYLLFGWLRKDDFPEAKATVIMASSNYCLLLTLLFASGHFFRLIVHPGIAVAGGALLLVGYYQYFIRHDRYVAIVKRFVASRSHQQVQDRTFAVAWALLNYFAIILYVWLRYD
ncbi:hypothetical protein AUC43_12835 [Hymenobacter sedentarius]|uniref:Uncharacterized protein n=1 Tax=Hymenobacter sedentarius TaxID=1411621 RepID=A0A0U4AR21_9BACT|nr:hypothetical protein [Hymenobacter sedentarius]ALW85904.1 hypothetical protein AUC43_12835 [Hymenobacter sedentarius]